MGIDANGNYKGDKNFRILELFFRALKGEGLSAQELAYEYNVSTRSVSRDIADLRAFLAEHRDILGNADLVYSSSNHRYTLYMDNLMTNKELLAVAKVLIGSHAFSNDELLSVIGKLKSHTSSADRQKLDELIKKELYQYCEISFDCNSVIDNIWALSEYIQKKRAITISYNKMNRSHVKHKIKPVSIMFSEYYFYLIAYKYDEDVADVPYYFRIDRIVDIVAHRENFVLSKSQNFDEGLLRKRSQFMWPGPLRRIRFQFTGPSVQAILDRIPTARVVEKKNGVSTIEAEVYGDGIKMFLLSQGSWVKVLGPEEFVREMKDEITKMQELY
ncbi:MAG: transcriptional regulator [Lachnospiraceae bacterium]|nr:transcriptional regulator [Lachnospiraceae bacterium]